MKVREVEEISGYEKEAEVFKEISRRYSKLIVKDLLKLGLFSYGRMERMFSKKLTALLISELGSE